MGAGKSTIVRLIDYCLGGALDMTPALQKEFVNATLALTVNEVMVTLSRERNSAQIAASWITPDGPMNIIVPADKANGELLPGTGVEVLSDLVMHIAGIRAPRVRKSKIRDDSALVRLSLRSFIWYCYLEQEEIDSSLFYLERGADRFRQLASQNVLRYLLGYNQEQVAEMEAELESARDRKLRAEEGAKALGRALDAAGLGSGDEITRREERLKLRRSEFQSDIVKSRNQLAAQHGHALDQLRERGRRLDDELHAIEDAIAAVERVTDSDTRHRNELTTLAMKFRRSTDARAVLNQVDFVACPRCTQPLPPPQPLHCRLCGQAESDATPEVAAQVDADIVARVSEIDDVIARHTFQLGSLRRERALMQEEKRRLDYELNEASHHYDSAYLSQVLHVERELATVEQQLAEFGRTRQLDQQREELIKEGVAIDVEIATLRKKLADARANAERDTNNLRLLEKIFLDCLVRSQLPGFSRADSVSITSPKFFPEVTSPGAEGTVTTTFSHLGSGGKKTLFKCCFAIAVHRLAREIGASLPTLLVIDTAMKNISERENRDQFAGFYSMLYELADGELSNTQFIIVDKEFYEAPAKFKGQVNARLMTPDDDAAPPLIRYYRGH